MVQDYQSDKALWWPIYATIGGLFIFGVVLIIVGLGIWESRELQQADAIRTYITGLGGVFIVTACALAVLLRRNDTHIESDVDD